MKDRGWFPLGLLAFACLLFATACDRSETTADPAPQVAETPAARVDSWVASGGWKAALSAIEHELTLTPDDPRWIAEAARAEMALGAFELAGQRLLTALAKAPTDPHLNTERGVYEYSRQRMAEAARVLQQVVDQAPELVRAQEYLGRALEFEAMIRMGTRGIDFDVLERSIAALERAVRLGETPERLQALGAVLERGQRFEDALRVHRRAVELDPEYAASWHAIGRVATELGGFEEAHRAYGPALRFAPEDAETWYDYGVLLEELEDPDKARMSYGKAIEYDRAFARAYYRLGLLTSQGGDTQTGERLIAEYERFQEIQEQLQAWRYEARTNPDDPEAMFQVGLAFARVLDWRQAEVWLQRAVATRPDDARAHFQLGRTYFSTERFAESLQELQRAIQLDPELLGAHRLLPQVAQQVGKPEVAAASFEAIARLEPDADAWFNVGQARRVVGTPERALEAFERCLKLAPEHALCLEMSARVELGLERDDAARAHANRLLALEPNHATAKAILAELDARAKR